MSSPNFRNVLIYFWRSIISNPVVHVFFLMYSLALLLLSAFPIVGFFFAMLWQISLFSVGAYLNRAILENKDDLQSFEDRIKRTSFSELLLSYPDTALGAFVGTFILAFIFQFCIIMIGIASFGSDFTEFILKGEKPPQVESQIDPVLFIGILLLLIVFLVVIWVAPVAYGYTLQQENFLSAFKGVFKVFNYDFFKATLRLDYVKMYFAFMITAFILIISGGILTLHPVTSPFGLALIYGSALLYFSFATHAYLLCKPFEK